jgi:hypothetical protein
VTAAAAGWRRIGAHPAIAAWAAAARTAAVAALDLHGDPWRAGGTWQVGLDALPNDDSGAIAGTPFPWAALGLPPQPLHRAQLSTLRPGYPQPGGDIAAHRWQLRRDNAHMDGLIAEGASRRRFVREPHAYILGLPLTPADPGASPLVVWEGSHLILRDALAAALAPHPPAAWGGIDITDAYIAARARCFAACPRVELPARPGEATLLHRHLLHGVAPWADGARAAPEGRIVAYLRPLMRSVADWLAP